MSRFLERSTSRSRTAFTLIEVAVAGGLLLMVAAVLTLVVTNSLTARASMTARSALTGELVAALDSVERQGFDTVLTDSFDTPLSCENATGEGSGGTSCFEFGSETFVGTWLVELAGDSVGSTSGAADGAAVTVSVEFADGSVLQQSRFVAAPGPGFNGEGVVRVVLSGADSSGPVFLLDETSRAVVGSAVPTPSRVALFRVPAGSCTAAAPCVVALSSEAPYTTDGTVYLAASDAFGENAKIVVPSGEVTQASALLIEPGHVTVNVAARGEVSSGQVPQVPATVANSVCLYASFNDGVAYREVPVCNDDAGVLRFNSYVDEVSGVEVGLPVGVDVRLLPDRSDGVCGAPGQVGVTSAGWEPAAVCTSWTWGVPTVLEVDATDLVLADTDLVSSASSDPVGTVVFTGALARPAAGFEDQMLWVNPREVGACAATSSCTSLGTTVPEDTLCPGEHCLAVRTPRFVAPLVGAAQVAGVDRAGAVGSILDFMIEVADDGGDPVTATVLNTVGSGSLFSVDSGGNATPVTDGTVIGVSPAGGGVFNLRFDETGAADLVWFTVRFENSLPNGTRDIDVALFDSPGVFTFAASDITVAQNDTTAADVTVFGADGQPAVGETVTVTSATPGLTVSSPVVVDSDGVATVNVTAGAVSAGTYPIAVAGSSGRSIDVNVNVAVAAGSLTLDPVSSTSQDGTTTARVEAVDGAGDPMANVAVGYVITDTNGDVATNMYVDNAGCVTGVDGSCTTTLVAEPEAAAGVYTLTVSSGGFTATRSFTVASVVASATTETAALISQGSTGDVAVVVADGTGVPMAGVPVTLTVPASLSVASGTVTSNGDGIAVFSVTVGSTVPAGTLLLSTQAAGISDVAVVTVQGAPASMVVASSTAVFQGSSTFVSATVLDGAGVAVSGATVDGSTTLPGLTVISGLSDTNGVALVEVVAATDAPSGSGTVELELRNGSGVVVDTATVNISVQAAPAAVQVLGAVHAASTTAVPIYVSDGTGNPVAGASVQLSGLPSNGSSTTALTGLNGEAVVEITLPAGLPAGVYVVGVDVTFGADELARDVALLVADVPANGSGPAAVTVAAGASETFTVTFTTAAGAPVRNAAVSAPSTAEVTVAADPFTDSAGSVSVDVTTAASTPSGSYLVDISVGTATFTTEVVIP